MAQIDIAYASLCLQVMHAGGRRPSRVGGTTSLPGLSLKTARVADEFPIITTRKVFPRGILGELCAFMRGATDLQTFKDLGCNYWDHNASQWAPNKGLPKEEWQVGRIYGVQWRDWNGVLDQIQALIDSIKQDPYGRRHLLTTWNPSELPQMCLPPCHLLAQFYVNGTDLDCIVTMRSVDLALGLPSDLVLYGALLMLIARATNYDTGRLHFQFGDAHIYDAHLEQLRHQLRSFGSIYVPQMTLSATTDILAPSTSDFVLSNYFPLEAIKYELL